MSQPNSRQSVKKLVHLIAAARPNFMKVAPLYHALKKTDWCEPVVVWMRQQEDDCMSGSLLVEFGVPNEDMIRRPVGTGTHASQTAAAMLQYGELCGWKRPDAVVVPGDVNTSMACALVAAKLGIPVVHLEAGLRSFDRSMPEEINRIVIDSISDLLWIPSKDAAENLLREGRSTRRIAEIGNIMIDAFEMLRPKIEAMYRTLQGTSEPHAVVTLHRPSNVDTPERLADVLQNLAAVSCGLRLDFVMHPRLSKIVDACALYDKLVRYGGRPEHISVTPPMGYVEFMALVTGATCVITDSGGVQEETTYLGIPCLTLRENTERPITVTHGTNQLVAPRELLRRVTQITFNGLPKRKAIPLWDGRTAERAVTSLHSFLFP